MHEWFKEFVYEVADAWKDSLDRVIQESITIEASLDPQKICKAGEELVAQVVRNRGYTIAFPPGSRTPADVWGLNKYPINGFDDWWHIIQVQVKSTAVLDKPRELVEKKREEAMKFLNFTEQVLQASETVPLGIKSSERVISIGYAGVIVDPEKYEPLNYDAHYIEHKTTPGLDHYGDLIVSKLFQWHQLLPQNGTSRLLDGLPLSKLNSIEN